MIATEERGRHNANQTDLFGAVGGVADSGHRRHDLAPQPVPNGGPQYAANPTASQLPLYATRQTVFAIPFAVDRRIAQPMEVHLYVSLDQGATWQLHSRQPPNTSQFTFRARGDGEYWFASRTLDGNQQSRPQGPLQPELRVVVDTVPPQLDFSARPGQGGDVITAWQIVDQDLSPASLKVEYQDGVGQPWKPVAIRQAAEDAARTNYQGQMTWWPETRSPTINIRAEVRDRAGNLAVVNRRLLLPALAAQARSDGSSGMSRPDDPFARNGRPSEGAVAWPSDNRSPALPSPSPGPQDNGPLAQIGTRSPAAAENADPPPAATPQVAGQLASNQAPANQRPWDPVATGSAPGQKLPPDAHVPGTPATGGSYAGEHAAAVPRPADVAVGGPSMPSAGPVASPVSSGTQMPPTGLPVLPKGERPQMTNATRFHLEYDIDAVGPSGVAEVQLWATADAGHSWRLWGADEDLQSPFDVVVEEEGIFGFHVVIVSRNGLSGRRPRTGDLADIWVGVDTTSPVAQLTSATYGEGANAGKLSIRWTASDAYLDPRPVTLKFAEAPEGPWTVIASALPNSGEFAWPADPQLPTSVYLRLEVRDEAGNLTVDQLAEPIRIDGLAPKARIRGVLPVPELDREAFRQPRRS